MKTSLMKDPRQIIPICILVALTACKTTEEALQERGVAPLTAAETTELLTDSTFRIDGDGWIWHGFYADDGTMRGKTVWDGGDKSGAGTWEVSADGLFCRDWDNDWGGGEYGCAALYREGDRITYVHRSGSAGSNPDGEMTMVGRGNVKSL